MQNTIRKKLFIQRPLSDVWDYLTKPELLSLWLMETDFQPIVGHRFHFKTPEDHKDANVISCEVLEVIPNKLLSYTWENGCHGETLDSMVIWTLEEKNGGTELGLEHTGFDLLEQLLSHETGWQSILNQLEQRTTTHVDINS